MIGLAVSKHNFQLLTGILRRCLCGKFYHVYMAASTATYGVPKLHGKVALSYMVPVVLDIVVNYEEGDGVECHLAGPY